MYCLISVSVDFRLVYLFGAHPFPPCVCVCPSVSRSSVYSRFSSLMLAKLRSGFISMLLLWVFGCVHDKVVGSCVGRAGSVCAWSYQSPRFSFLTVYFLFAKKNRLRKWSVSAGDPSVPRVSIVGGASLQTPQWEQVEAVANHLSKMCISVWGTAKLYYI